MLFHVTFEFTDQSEDAEKRSLGIFANWSPPEGADFQSFYGFVDGTGGFAVIEADSALALGKAIAPFTPWMTFTTTPIVPIEEAAGLGMEAVAFRDSVS